MNYYRILEFTIPNGKKGHAIALNRKEYMTYLSIINKCKYPTTIYTYDNYEDFEKAFYEKVNYKEK